jgi:hypothetical protein
MADHSISIEEDHQCVLAVQQIIDLFMNDVHIGTQYFAEGHGSQLRRRCRWLSRRGRQCPWSDSPRNDATRSTHHVRTAGRCLTPGGCVVASCVCQRTRTQEGQFVDTRTKRFQGFCPERSGLHMRAFVVTHIIRCP